MIFDATMIENDITLCQIFRDVLRLHSSYYKNVLFYFLVLVSSRVNLEIHYNIIEPCAVHHCKFGIMGEIFIGFILLFMFVYIYTSLPIIFLRNDITLK